MVKKANQTKRLKAIFAAAAASMTITAAPATAGNHSLPIDQSVYSQSGDTLAQEKRMSGILINERSCLTLSEFLNAPHNYLSAPSHETLTRLFNSSAFSRDLMQDAANQDVKVCDMELDETIAGVHIPSQNKIGLDFNRRDSIYSNMAYMAHEFAHYTQFLNGSEYFDANRSIYDNQRVILAMETAAPVAELIAIFYAEQNGEASGRRAFPSYTHQYDLYKDFKRDYRRQINAGAPHGQAINTAAQNAWVDAFDDQHKLDHYNNILLAFTLLNISQIEPHIAAQYTDPNLKDSIRGAGQLSENTDFANPDVMPSGDDLFGRNDRMQKIFEAVEWYRQSRIYGADNAYVVALQDSLRANGNRYVDVNFDEAAQKIRNGTTPERAISSSVDRAPSRMVENYDPHYAITSISITYRTPPPQR